MTERSVRLLPMKPAPENTRGGKARLLSRFRDTVRLNANGLSLDPDCAALHPKDARGPLLEQHATFIQSANWTQTCISEG